MSFDYLAASAEEPPGVALTPNSTAADAAGLVEVLKLVTDPAAHKKALAEQQQIRAEWAAINRERRDLRKAAALQAEELRRLRQEFDAALAIDKENHLSALRQREEKFAARLAEFEQVMAGVAAVTS